VLVCKDGQKFYVWMETVARRRLTFIPGWYEWEYGL
jgi:hypothetical protein